MNSPEKKSKPQPIKFITEKDSSFRIFHADGAWGMLSNTGNIQLNFFVEHVPMPSAVVFRSDDKGTLRIADISDVTVEEGGENFLIVRNYQSAIVISLDAARQIHGVIGNFIKLAEQQVGVTQNEK